MTKKLIIRPIALLLLISFLFQDIVWANPDITSPKAALQIPLITQNPSLEIEVEYALRSVLIMYEWKLENVGLAADMRLPKSGSIVRFDFEKKKKDKENDNWTVPYSIVGRNEQYEAVVNPDDRSIEIRKLGDSSIVVSSAVVGEEAKSDIAQTKPATETLPRHQDTKLSVAPRGLLTRLYNVAPKPTHIGFLQGTLYLGYLTLRLFWGSLTVVAERLKRVLIAVATAAAPTGKLRSGTANGAEATTPPGFHDQLDGPQELGLGASASDEAAKVPTRAAYIEKKKVKELAARLEMRKNELSKYDWTRQEIEILNRILDNISTNPVNDPWVIHNDIIEMRHFLESKSLDKEGFWYTDRIQVLDILKNITAYGGNNVAYYVAGLGHFLTSDAIKNKLSKGSLLRKRRHEILAILNDMGVLKYIYDFECFLTSGFVRKSSDDIIEPCFSSRLGVKLSKIKKSQGPGVIILPGNSFLRSFQRLGYFCALFQSTKEEILTKVLKRSAREGRINTLIHPLTSRLFTLNDVDISIINPDKDLTTDGKYPIIEKGESEFLPTLDFNQLPGLNEPSVSLSVAGRSILTDTGWALKLMRKEEYPTFFNFEPYAFETLRKSQKSNQTKYNGIVPEPYLPKGAKRNRYLFKISANSMKLLGVNPIKLGLYQTIDGAYVGFIYHAQKGYFNYAKHFTYQETLQWFENLAILLKQFGILHNDLISMFHDVKSRRKYSLDYVPAGCIDNLDINLMYPNLRSQGTIGDLSKEHLTRMLAQGIRDQLFQLMLLLSQRLERAKIKPSELTNVLESGIGTYCKTICGRELPELKKIDFTKYSREILYRLRHKQDNGNGPVDLGKDNGALSMHDLADLSDYVALAILKEFIRQSKPIEKVRSGTKTGAEATTPPGLHSQLDGPPELGLGASASDEAAKAQATAPVDTNVTTPQVTRSPDIVQNIWEEKEEPVWDENLTLENLKELVHLANQEAEKLEKSNKPNRGKIQRRVGMIFLKSIINAAKKRQDLTHIDWSLMERALGEVSSGRAKEITSNYLISVIKKADSGDADSKITFEEWKKFALFVYDIKFAAELWAYRYQHLYKFDMSNIFRTLLDVYFPFVEDESPSARLQEINKSMYESKHLQYLAQDIGGFWDEFDRNNIEDAAYYYRMLKAGYPYYFDLLAAQISNLQKQGSITADKIIGLGLVKDEEKELRLATRLKLFDIDHLLAKEAEEVASPAAAPMPSDSNVTTPLVAKSQVAKSEVGSQGSGDEVAIKSADRYAEYFTHVKAEATVAWKEGMHVRPGATIATLLNTLAIYGGMYSVSFSVKGEKIMLELAPDKLVYTLDLYFKKETVEKGTKVLIELECDSFNAEFCRHMQEIANLIKECFEDEAVNSRDKGEHYRYSIKKIFSKERERIEETERLIAKFEDVIAAKEVPKSTNSEQGNSMAATIISASKSTASAEGQRFLRDLTKPNEATRNLLEMIIDVLLSKKKLVLAFHHNLKSSEIGQWHALLRRLDTLKSKPLFEKLLKNLIIIPSFVTQEKLVEELQGQGVDIADKENYIICEFAPNAEREKLASSALAIHSIFIDEPKDFDPALHYYPLFEIVTITLTKYFKQCEISDLVNELGANLNELNIKDVNENAGVLIFTLIPKAGPIDGNDRMSRYALLKRFLEIAA